jgi:archaellum component FlaF (FlaF/FlaG flagellin family)
MKYNKGFTAIAAIILIGIIILGGVVYVAFKPEVLESPTENQTQENTLDQSTESKVSI